MIMIIFFLLIIQHNKNVDDTTVQSFSPPRVPRTYYQHKSSVISISSNSNIWKRRTSKSIFDRNIIFVLHDNKDQIQDTTRQKVQSSKGEYKDGNNNHKRKYYMRNNNGFGRTGDTNKNGKQKRNYQHTRINNAAKIEYEKESSDVINNTISQEMKVQKEYKSSKKFVNNQSPIATAKESFNFMNNTQEIKVQNEQKPLNSKKIANTNPTTTNEKKKYKTKINKKDQELYNSMHDLFYHPLPSPNDDHDEPKQSNPLEKAQPVKELFYQSTQSLSTASDDDDDDDNTDDSTNDTNQDDDDDDETKKHDDEELPFSAEQSNKLTVPKNNKIQVRRNFAPNQQSRKRNDVVSSKLNSNRTKSNSKQTMTTKKQYSKFKKQYNSKTKSFSSGNNNIKTIHYSKKRYNKYNTTSYHHGRKVMVRRGMEMLVGGEPINADPPLRFMELYYDEVDTDWASIISINSRDFGPLLHAPTISKVSNNSRELYCENLVDKLMKWNICPDDLIALVHDTIQKQHNTEQDATSKKKLGYKELLHMINEYSSSMNNKQNIDYSMNSVERGIKEVKAFAYSNNNTFATAARLLSSSSFVGHHLSVASSKKGESSSSISADTNSRPTTSIRNVVNSKDDIFVLQGGELKFSLGLPKAVLSCNHDDKYSTLRRMLRHGISSAIQAKELGFIVKIVKLTLSSLNDDEEDKTDDGDTNYDSQTYSNEDSQENYDANFEENEITQVSVQFTLYPSYTTKKSYKKNSSDSYPLKSIMKKVNLINLALSHSVDEGHMALHLAAATRREKGWAEDVKEKIVEELLFEIDDGDVLLDEDDSEEDDNEEEEDDTDAVSDYMEEDKSKQLSKQISSPYKGTLGPILLDAVISKARQRYPKVIAIGDVHGCLDELQALLKACDYRPGDQVIFLGDLVSKGPDSTGVVQMAREIGAIGVRGNHDFEVIRWHQAIKSGADPPVIGSDHFKIASNLAKPELKWLYSLPWYISSKELNALFVHAGFVSGIRLSKQNPRLMMNMRSILPDGTVTSKYFNNWPWARLWDGPQTVLFGHDADRNLQQYEHAIGLDTGCVYGGRLSACILPDKRIISVPAKREYFQYRRKHFD